MTTSPDTDLQEAPLATATKPPGPPGRLRRAGEDAVVWLHRQADRLDLLPAEFGQEAEVDEASAGSLLREWLRQAKLWAAYNPEEMLALKVGAAALGATLFILVVLVGAIR